MSEELLRVARGGLMTTVQDMGRLGTQQTGLPPGGAMDMLSLQTANILAGNARGDACLEITLLGPTLLVLAQARLALHGADLSAMLDGSPLAPSGSFEANPGQILSFGRRRTGARTYLAVSGGISVPLVLGSRSTYLAAAFGGHEGRRLAEGDVILREGPSERVAWKPLRAAQTAWPEEEGIIRIMRGPQFELFSEKARERFLDSPFTLSPKSDRMGARLEGPPLPPPPELSHGIVSEPTPLGTMQVSPDGSITILMADRPTIGGYAKIATVISADIPLVAQCYPEMKMRFVLVTLDEAHEALRSRERDLKTLEWAVRYWG